MPRKFSYNVLLDQDEQNSLQAITRKYTSAYCDVMRAKVILLAADGLGNQKIGERLQLPRQIVLKWRKRFFEERLAGLEKRPGRGRPTL